jgi:hypothetical protein
MNDLDKLIKKAEDYIQYYQQKIDSKKIELDAFYTARDAKADNPYTK